jgi:hypothetical protein
VKVVLRKRLPRVPREIAESIGGKNGKERYLFVLSKAEELRASMERRIPIDEAKLEYLEE